MTVQAPHWPRPHPNFGPLSARSSLRTNRSGVAGSASTVWVRPLTSRVTCITVASRLWPLAFRKSPYQRLKARGQRLEGLPAALTRYLCGRALQARQQLARRRAPFRGRGFLLEVRAHLIPAAQIRGIVHLRLEHEPLRAVGGGHDVEVLGDDRLLADWHPVLPQILRQQVGGDDLQSAGPRPRGRTARSAAARASRRCAGATRRRSRRARRWWCASACAGWGLTNRTAPARCGEIDPLADGVPLQAARRRRLRLVE